MGVRISVSLEHRSGMSGTNFISQQSALELIGRADVSFVDGSWYLPDMGRDAKTEFSNMRIPGAVFFDIDAIADQDTDLPHMLPSPEDFAKQVSVLGISDQHLIVVYDGPGLFSAARVWWTFKVMGAPDVRILEGGLDAWKAKGLPLETGNPNPPRAHLFNANFSADRVADMGAVQENIGSENAIVVDARPEARFKGEAPEPRPGLRGGHIPKSVSLPYENLVVEGKLRPREELDRSFTEMGIHHDTSVITSCGSGVTAAILTLALAESGRPNCRIYDGSWAQWGQPDGPPVETDE